MVKLIDVDDISDLIYNVPYVNFDDVSFPRISHRAFILSDNSIIDYNHGLHCLVGIQRIEGSTGKLLWR